MWAFLVFFLVHSFGAGNAAAEVIDSSLGDVIVTKYGVFTAFDTPEQVTSSSHMAVDHNGDIWLCNWHKLYRMHDGVWEEIPDETSGITSPVTIYVDSRNRVYFYECCSCTVIYDNGVWKKNTIYASQIDEDDDGTIWYAAFNNGAVKVLNDSTFKKYSSWTGELPGYRATGLAFQENGVKWFTVLDMAGNHYIMRFENGTWSTYDYSEYSFMSLGSNPVKMFSNKHGWLGILATDMYLFDGAAWKKYDAFITDVECNRDGVIWFITIERVYKPAGSLMVFKSIVRYDLNDMTTITFDNYSGSLSGKDNTAYLNAMKFMKDCTDIYIDDRGYVWMLGESKIWRFEDYKSPVSVEPEKPEPFTALTNSPNPFNMGTAISFTIDTDGQYSDLSIYDCLGRKITTLVSQTLSAGRHTYYWNGKSGTGGRDVSSGIFIARLSSGKQSLSHKMLLVK